MKKPFWFILGTVWLLTYCEPAAEQLDFSTDLRLEFSADTVIFDTLLTARTSLTRRLRIFNPNERAIEASIRLGLGTGSPYRLIINGRESDELSNEVIYGGDSLLVLAQVTIDPQDESLPFVVKDSIVVDWNQQTAHVKLVAWGQDAHVVNAEVLGTTTWTADRPYLIYNYAFVDSLATLTLEPGTRVYLDNGASLFVQGTLRAEGDSANHIIFRNTRFDANYQEAPGQWGGIIFLESSRNNLIRYAEIENGEIGLGVGYTILTQNNQTFFLPENGPLTAQLQVDHTSIRHMSLAGMLAFSSEVSAYNVEIYNVGTYLVGNFAGGDYEYVHCTFSAYPSFFSNNDPMVQFSDHVILSPQLTLTGDLSLTLLNNIIWGPGNEQLVISGGEQAQVLVQMTNNIIRSAQSWVGEANFASTDENFPGFRDPFAFDFGLDSLAFARDKALPTDLPTDITGALRDDQPDIGAYERFDAQ